VSSREAGPFPSQATAAPQAGVTPARSTGREPGPAVGSAEHADPELTLADLHGQPCTVLKDEGPGAARVLRYDLPGGAVVLKTWEGGGSRMVSWYGRFLLRREIRAYRRLQGCPGIARLRGTVGPDGLILDWLDARPLHRKLPTALLEAGLDDLQRVLAELHRRRFAHLDLHQKLNVLIDGGGRAWLIDLGQACDARRFPARLVFPLLAAIDRRAVLKFRARYAPATLPADRRERIVARHAPRRDWWPKRVGRWLRKRLVGR